MADDGLMLNFELPSNAFSAPTARLKGGSWKDRLTARKSAEYRRKKALDRSSQAEGSKVKPSRTDVADGAADVADGAVGVADGAADVADGAADVDRKTVEGRPAKRARVGHDVLPKTNDGQVITSLFSFNKAATAPREAKPDIQDEEIEASNAPLTEEAAKFTSLGLSPILASHLLNKLHIAAPTAIQRKAVTQLVSHDTDAFIQAQTGSGKTLAYLLPIVERISLISKRMKDEGSKFDRHSGLFAVILAPTRELARQIAGVLDKLLSCYHWVIGGTVVGGENKKSEKSRLRKGLNILVATPGRMADHLENTEALELSNVRWLVLDEGDQLMDQGFEQDIQKIISVLNLRSRKRVEKPIPGLPERRTTVLCSATLQSNVEQLRAISLKDPVSIAVDNDPASRIDGHNIEDNNFSAPAQLKQSYAIVPPKQRLVTLVATLKQQFKRKGSVMKCIVFMSCADSVDFHFELLTRGDKTATTEEEIPSIAKQHKPGKHSNSTVDRNKIAQGNTIAEARTEGTSTSITSRDSGEVKVFRLHGSLQQSTRTSTLKAFSTTEDPAVLVCTDVAARGLDLPNVDLVIEYDPPFSKDDHLHRIGRTARAGRDGRAMIFLQPGCEEGYIEILKESQPRNLTRHESEELLRKGFSPTSGVVLGREWEQIATEFQLDIEQWALKSPKHLEQARRAFQSHVRAYATHVSAERGIFNMQELHLGHLAKAFALRDKPGAIKVPGLRPGAGKDKRGKAQAIAQSKSGAKRTAPLDDAAEATDADAAKRKMQQMSRKMGGASEFNLG